MSSSRVRTNDQPTEPLDRRSDGSLDVVNCWATIQGEGPFAGTPAVFLRLAGCNLSCPGCDTEYTTGRNRLSAEEVRDWVESKAPIGWGLHPLLVITGGEPFRQNLVPFLRLLLFDHPALWRVQVETSGTLPAGPDFYPNDHLRIVCSPKYKPVADFWKGLGWVHDLKYLVADGEVSADDGLPVSVLGVPVRPERPWPDFKGTVWLQPEYTGDVDQDQRNVQVAVRSCLKFGHRLSLQTHRIIGVE